MSRLAVAMKGYLERPGLSARGLETKAGLPAMTIGTILKDAHPRPERMAALLNVLPPDVAHEMLTAYLLDDCPEPWQKRVEITINGTPSKAELAATTRLHRALLALSEAAESDTALGDWVVETAQFMRLIPRGAEEAITETSIEAAGTKLKLFAPADQGLKVAESPAVYLSGATADEAALAAAAIAGSRQAAAIGESSAVPARRTSHTATHRPKPSR